MGIARNRMLVAALMAAVLTMTPASAAQDAPAQAEAARPIVPVRLLVIISEHDGDTETSRLPYMLWVNANEQQDTMLRAAQQVPIPQAEFVPPEGLEASMSRSFSYQNIGATINARADAVEGGRFRVFLSVSDSTIVPTTEPGGLVRIKSLSTSNVLLLRDGQVADFLAATDRITGTVTRIEVTLTVLE